MTLISDPHFVALAATGVYVAFGGRSPVTAAAIGTTAYFGTQLAEWYEPGSSLLDKFIDGRNISCG